MRRRLRAPRHPAPRRPEELATETPRGVWLIAGTPTDEPYPCMCDAWRPCHAWYCPCAGRGDYASVRDELPADCCAHTTGLADVVLARPGAPERRRVDAVAEPDRGCPLCGGDHDGCTFAAGSLRCVKPDCRNPHHR